ncbi:MAG: UDP-N-acetylglucosamine 1-carboxyvinyltransferase [Rickettsiales bacterium]|nr:UDP-N-acetylglucosamine 1-carboxyvinyltransferase [Pseudomonadota bacterium]MDA0966944.1 UDP-N-acetylglucosamine 1-carboxyvinyltransferase [Pseudomonadota bacterium]MDG4543863.1 UDP-N-acetylglucosamine 1-carboxyvinyltransferase [Rickettsiales bacterium]MDG4546009.1 UDP-N-acetylglucosamine 1-carboxyvinyltransferase [Rickettsiales bacterium]MDG4548255.1 UDP-N-acetylglucosamine 1-carboxyvinyltransferase [Rickettsiales bacterium]
MDKIKINGGIPLKGEVKIGGAKNAALPLMAAAMLTEGRLKLNNLPHIADISTMANLLVQHGVDMELDAVEGSAGGGIISLCAKNIKSFEAPYDIVRKMRASVLVLGPLLARFGDAKVSLPGGCAIGTRPIDLHLQAFEKMGAKIELEEGYIKASVKGKLRGAEIHFEKVSVGATENVMMAACLADGETTIINAAQEPEVVDLAQCLVKMGAKITGIGTGTLKIEGLEKLNGAEHSVISDRIEAGSYMIAAAITNGDIRLHGVDLSIMESTIERLTAAGVLIEELSDNSVRAARKQDKLKSVDAITLPYPGFPTDMQAQFMALMCLAEGNSIINETIFENRFMHVSELTRMGADISIEGHKALVKGVTELKGAELMATDLRASVSLVLAALAAKGQTVINRVYHIDRGYERIEEKMMMLGADIERIK